MSDGDAHPLRALLEETREEEGCSMGALTVLSQSNDPFRQDTPAKHRNGSWLARCVEQLGYGDRTIHVRGLHYAISQAPEPILKPDGEPYRNNDKDWWWLANEAAKSARWLGYIPFEQIVDERNAEPVVREFSRPYPVAGVWRGGVFCKVGELSFSEPYSYLDYFRGVQLWRIAIFGEKASLTGILDPISSRFGTDIYLPKGEISDTFIYRMAKDAAEDGRPLVVLTVSDCDPSGWQMPISIGRKLQAFKALEFSELEFRVVRAGLTPDQVRDHSLPSTPLKETEKRADRWAERMGVEQTEVDAVTTPANRSILERVVKDAIAPYFDGALAKRVTEVKLDWNIEALRAIRRQVDERVVAELKARAETAVEQFRGEITEVNGKLEELTRGVKVPPVPDIPEAEVDTDGEGVLIDSQWNFAEQCRALIASKRYEETEAG